jgi:acyl-coenzyme A synthetase/AMP-(fatty) acid ligase
MIAAAARLDPDLVNELRAQGFAIVRGFGSENESIMPPSVDDVAASPGIWLLTSGSTGRPKRVRHTLASLTTVSTPQPPRVWLCAYSPGAYAWWQVITLGLAHPDTNIVCVDSSELDRWPEMAKRHRVTAISGTPTFWRHALWRDGQGVTEIPLEQVTLGGEPVDQSILDALRRIHPQARISWIYASSEAGAVIAVHDGLAGFPIAWLDREAPGRPRISVEEDELVLVSPFASEGSGASLRTGDRVEIVDDRVRIVGRIESDEINVGGSKVSASAVREALLKHPDVGWASVRGRRAPIVGQVVVADVVLKGETTTAQLREFCTRTLQDHAVPRQINVLADIPLTESLKSRV